MGSWSTLIWKLRLDTFTTVLNLNHIKIWISLKYDNKYYLPFRWAFNDLFFHIINLWIKNFQCSGVHRVQSLSSYCSIRTCMSQLRSRSKYLFHQKKKNKKMIVFFSCGNFKNISKTNTYNLWLSNAKHHSIWFLVYWPLHRLQLQNSVIYLYLFGHSIKTLENWRLKFNYYW